MVLYNVFVAFVALCMENQLGMCNCDRVLDYPAVTAMIDHENDDRGGIVLLYCIKKFWLL